MHYQRARLCQRSRAELGYHGLSQGDLNARPAVEKHDFFHLPGYAGVLAKQHNPSSVQ